MYLLYQKPYNILKTMTAY